MGCATSKEKVCKNCQEPFSPVRRSYSKHQKAGDSHRVVALTSSTLGSLRHGDPLVQNHPTEEDKENGKNPSSMNNQTAVEVKSLIANVVVIDKEKESPGKDEFATGMVEAKTWSKMINEKIPKVIPNTPTRTPPGEPETINAWEMMEGLEDISPLRPVHHFSSFSSPKPLWSELDNSDSNDTSIASEYDPGLIATFRKALEDLPPANPFHLKPLEDEKQSKDCSFDGKCEKNSEKIVSRGTDKLIVYFTSLRGVRKTYEDCCHVRVILKGLRVKVDERDVSMHSGFKEELKELLGDAFGGGDLPRIFLGRRCIGGAEEIRQLNEEGRLEKLVECCELVDDGGGNGKACEACGDIRFVPCETCSGSCKVYYDGEEEQEEEVVEELDGSNEHEGGFQRCPDCNENGLIRCPICCDSI